MVENNVDAGKIKQYVLETVSEKTGYPVDMLDLDLDLEADLGVDTVKQAELFATVRTHFGIPKREDLRLSEYNTLAKVISFVEDGLSSGEIVQPVGKTERASEPEKASPIQSVEQGGLKPYQGLLFVSAADPSALKRELQQKLDLVTAGNELESKCPSREELDQPERLAIDYENSSELAKRLEKAISAFDD